MNTDELHARYDLPSVQDTPEGRVLEGHERAGRRAVSVHRLDRLDAATRDQLVTRARAEEEGGRGEVAVHVVDGTPVIVTPRLPDGSTLDRWLAALGGPPGHAGGAGGSTAPGVSAPGSFTAIFGAPASSNTDAGGVDAGREGSTPAPAASPDATTAPPPVPATIRIPLKLSVEPRQGAETATPSAGSAPPPPPTLRDIAPNQGTPEQLTDAPTVVIRPPGSPVPPPAAQPPGAFTAIFGASGPATPPTAADSAPHAPAAPPAVAPADTPSNPAATAPPEPTSSAPPAPGAAEGPGEFTRLFSQSPPAPPAPPKGVPAAGRHQAPPLPPLPTGGSMGGLPPLGAAGDRADGSPGPSLRVRLPQEPPAPERVRTDAAAPPSGSATGMMRAAPERPAEAASPPSLVLKLPVPPTPAPGSPPSSSPPAAPPVPPPAAPVTPPATSPTPSGGLPPLQPMPGATPPPIPGPGLPGLPGLPDLPGAPQAPRMPQAPQAPRLPTPGMPNVGLPPVPGLPSSRGAGAPGAPVVPSARPPSEFTQVLQGFQGAPPPATPGALPARPAPLPGPASPRKKPSMVPLVIVLNVVVMAAIALILYFALRN